MVPYVGAPEIKARRLVLAIRYHSHIGNPGLKRFVRKGLIKCVNLRANRLRYLLTPKGIAEKSRLTYEFWDYSLHLYQEVRQHLRTVLSRSVANGVQRIAIYGTGEAAELAYLSLKELGLEPVAIFDGGAKGAFLGMPIRAIDGGVPPQYELMVIATLESPERLIAELVSNGVEAGRLVTLRQPSESGLPTGAGGRRTTLQTKQQEFDW